MLVLSVGYATADGSPQAPGGTAGATAPALTVQTVAAGLTHGWDVGFLPDGKVLVTQRTGKFALLSSARPGATVTTLRADTSSVRVLGEGGLMGLVIHPDFATTREFTACQTYQQNNKPVDIRLVTWKLGTDNRSATKVKDLLTGLPISQQGRHSGCRPTIGPDGALLVGTGDTANPTVAQNKNSFGGKVLRIDLHTGKPLPDNPFPGSPVYNYGHRNVQGVAVRSNGQVLTAEQGPDKDDEVNLLVKGANYGWDPSRGGTSTKYDETVPMTDLTRFPDAVPAKWSSGTPTEATCGDTFLAGKQWGEWDGALAIVALKGAKLIVLTLDEQANVVSKAIPAEVNGKFGRLRAARTGPDGALYVTTSTGSNDKLLRIAPTGS
ncbi:PQQ-dependent sugar dehydrogenase [Actinokineospora enzanensis]|uniref:PQQ-dependent sugar dehydrogenase n=1 Tax=Actinokineospora enzanensis TaxID=155975 RepID=UPI00037C6171|nr:PQQ-dependent sugar dehydrogenase [Actinokineospora enzanensis]